MLQKIKGLPALFVTVLAVSLIGLVLASQTHAAYAATTPNGGGGGNDQTEGIGTPDPAIKGGNCADVTKGCDLFDHYINPFIGFLGAFVGVAVVISIIIGGIQYGSSAGDPSKVTAAKNRIRNAVISLVTFIFLYALLNFLIPGGLF